MPKIEKLFAFIAEDDGPDDEGVVARYLPHSGIMMPLIGADMARVNTLRYQAQEIARETGKVIRLIEFSQRTELEVIEP